MHQDNLHLRHKHASDEIRSLLIKKVKVEGHKIKKAASDLEINYSTARSIIKVYEKEERIISKPRGGHPATKVTEEIRNAVEEILEENKSQTLRTLKERIAEDFNVNLCIETMRKILGSLKITFKRASLVLEKVNEEEVKIKRKAYSQKYLQEQDLDDRYNIFIDECGFNLHLRRAYGRAKSGERVKYVVPTVRGTNTTLLAAINGEEVLHYMFFMGSCNSERYILFLKDLQEKLRIRRDYTKYTIFMDNARAHTSCKCKEFMSTLPFGYQYLSPYSYMLNPIEFLFSKVKSIVRFQLGDQTDIMLNDVISSALSMVTSGNIAGWYRLTRRNCSLAINLNDFC